VFLEVDATIQQPRVSVATNPEFTSDDRVDVNLGEERNAIDEKMHAVADGHVITDAEIYGELPLRAPA